MDACLEEHKQEEAKLRDGLIALQKKLDAAEEEQNLKLSSQGEEYEKQILEIKKQHEELLGQIDQVHSFIFICGLKYSILFVCEHNQ